MATNPPYQHDSIFEAELQQLRGELIAKARLDEKVKQEEQLREDAEFKKNLDNKNLGELMEMQKRQQEEVERKVSALNAIKRGDMSALPPLLGGMNMDLAAFAKGRNEWDLIEYEDIERMDTLMREKHISVDVIAAKVNSIEYVKQGQDPARQLEASKKWLNDTFPARATAAMLVKDRQGDYVIVNLGVSDEEIKAAKDLQADKLRAEDKSSQVTARIQEKIREGLQTTTALATDHTVTALATPATQRQSQEFTPAQRT